MDFLLGPILLTNDYESFTNNISKSVILAK